MTPGEIQNYEEQLTLAILLVAPQANRWELDGLSLDLFVGFHARQVAEALIAVRDSGQRVHWRRVRRWLCQRGRRDASAFALDLWRSIGTAVGLTQSISYLTHAREQRRVATRRAA